MTGMRNKFVNDFKLEIGLYLSASEASRTAIDIVKAGYNEPVYTEIWL